MIGNIAAYIISYGIGIVVEKYWLKVPPPTLVEMKQSRSCDVIFSSQRPLYKEDDWQYLRDLWSSPQQEKRNYKIIKTKNNNNNTKFISPIQSGQTIDGKGRGLFATRYIKRGEMTYNGGWGDHLIKFQNGQSYRKFVYAIEDDGMACDVMLWTYPLENNLIFHADDTSLMNDVRMCIMKCMSLQSCVLI